MSRTTYKYSTLQYSDGTVVTIVMITTKRGWFRKTVTTEELYRGQSDNLARSVIMQHVRDRTPPELLHVLRYDSNGSVNQGGW